MDLQMPAEVCEAVGEGDNVLDRRGVAEMPHVVVAHAAKTATGEPFNARVVRIGREQSNGFARRSVWR
jgi:hypothetical protein